MPDPGARHARIPTYENPIDARLAADPDSCRAAEGRHGSGEMTSEASPGKPEGGWVGLLRRAAMITVLAGAGGSIGLMLRVGHRNNSRLLLALFGIWVLSPFIALVSANLVSKRWSVLARTTLSSVTLVLTLGSLAVYGDVAFGPPRAKPAFAFLVVPLASWLLIAIVVPIAARISGSVTAADRERRGQ
jgi:hypothetical protein